MRSNRSSFDTRSEKKSEIDNLQLIEDGHEFRTKEVIYGEDYLLLPKFVFLALSKWYNCNKVIERLVIKDPKNKVKKGAFSKIDGKHCYELEILPKLIYFD